MTRPEWLTLAAIGVSALVAGMLVEFRRFLGRWARVGASEEARTRQVYEDACQRADRSADRAEEAEMRALAILEDIKQQRSA